MTYPFFHAINGTAYITNNFPDKMFALSFSLSFTHLVSYFLIFFLKKTFILFQTQPNKKK